MPHPNTLSLAALEGPDFLCLFIVKKVIEKLSASYNSPLWCGGEQSGPSPGSPGFKYYHIPNHFSSLFLDLIH